MRAGRVMQYVVIADDLTGASDAGLQFAKRGLRTTVLLEREPTLLAVDADVVVVDTDTRSATPEDAHWRMKALLARVRPLTPSRIVKKIDSTLRGNVGPELRALLNALPDAVAIVCPAFPKQGRTCRDGIVFVDGVRVDETSFARDPLAPVADARVAAQIDAPTAALTLAQMRTGTETVNAAVEFVRAHGIRVVVADAETDDDLRALAAVAAMRDDVLWVGSSGLIEMLASSGPEVVAEISAAVPPAIGPVAFIVGSPGDMTRQQIEAFAAAPGRDTELVDALDLLESTAAADRARARAAAALSGGVDTLVALDTRDDGIARALEFGKTQQWDAVRTSRRIRERLVAMVDESVPSDGGRTVVLSGGDVARTFCEHRGIRGLKLIAEVAPGIPISRAIGAELYVVTKAGGFGHPQTYLDIAAALHPQVPT